MFSEQSLKLISTMIEGVQLKPSANDFVMMAQAFETLKRELLEAVKSLKTKKEPPPNE